MSSSQPVDFAQIRQHIEKLEGRRRAADVLPFGVTAIDNRLPGGGLAMDALHEVTGMGAGVVDSAAAGAFAAGIVARTRGTVLWCASETDLFAPGLAQLGLIAERVIHVRADEDVAVLAACEEGLRHGGLSAVVGEVSRLSMMASRRLQLAAEEGRTLAVVVRRWRREKDAVGFGVPTAATTRWRVASQPSLPLPVPGIGRARWRLQMVRCKGGNSAEFDVEACDDQGCLSLAAPLVHRPAAAPDGAIARCGAA